MEIFRFDIHVCSYTHCSRWHDEREMESSEIIRASNNGTLTVPFSKSITLITRQTLIYYTFNNLTYEVNDLVYLRTDNFVYEIGQRRLTASKIGRP